MTLNSEQPRDQDGQFGEKLGSAPELNLSGVPMEAFHLVGEPYEHDDAVVLQRVEAVENGIPGKYIQATTAEGSSLMRTTWEPSNLSEDGIEVYEDHFNRTIVDYVAFDELDDVYGLVRETYESGNPEPVNTNSRWDFPDYEDVMLGFEEREGYLG